MAEPDCTVCYQPILQAPRLCFACGQSIQAGQNYRYIEKDRTCTPVHADCGDNRLPPPASQLGASDQGLLL